MSDQLSQQGLSTLVHHFAEGQQPHHAYVMPIYQTSLFSFPDHATGVAIYDGLEKNLQVANDEICTHSSIITLP